MKETYDSTVPTADPFNTRDALRSIEKVRRPEIKYNARVMLSHSMSLFNGMKKIPEYYG